MAYVKSPRLHLLKKLIAYLVALSGFPSMGNNPERASLSSLNKRYEFNETKRKEGKKKKEERKKEKKKKKGKRKIIYNTDL